MSLLVTGSIGIDTVKTPYGLSEDCLGGSSVYFSMAASFFTPVRLLGVVGQDCPFDLSEVFAERQVDLTGLEVRKSSKTFRWTGRYLEDMNERITERLELNVLGEAPPAIPDKYRDSKFVFLANTAPRLQLELLGQIEEPVFVAADTMDCWIKEHSDDLKDLLNQIDCLVVNDEEARLLAGKSNLLRAAEQILKLGPDVVVIKKGESGSVMSDSEGNLFVLPAYPVSNVKDPTGAGDSFAGAFMGYLASYAPGERADLEFNALKKAAAYGTVVASFTVEDFSLAALSRITRNDIDDRFEELQRLTRF